MKKKAEDGTQRKKTKGYRSLTAMLISVICIMVSIPTVGNLGRPLFEAVHGGVRRIVRGIHERWLQDGD